MLETLAYLKHETSTWLEITTLLIPGENDSPQEIEALSAWVTERHGADVPLHFTAFHPDWKMREKPPTPKATVLKACRIARSVGLHYVYSGNVHDEATQSTYCHRYGASLIGRDWHTITAWHLADEGCCMRCGSACAGVFDSSPGTSGRQRRPLVLDLSFTGR